MEKDPKGTKYCAELDIHHFYESLTQDAVLARLKEIVKDRKVLDLAERVSKDGILIGAYYSQWFANTMLQPLDHMIRQSGHRVSHYIRYMDNFTIFSPNKRELRKLVGEIETWLNAHGLRLKENWQIFRTNFSAKVEKRHQQMSKRKQSFRKPRIPTALGYRYGHGYTLLRKRNLLRLKRQLAKYYKKMKQGKRIAVTLAQGLLSRIGQLKHCRSCHIFKRYIKPKTQRALKAVVREYTRKEKKKWITYSDLLTATA